MVKIYLRYDFLKTGTILRNYFSTVYKNDDKSRKISTVLRVLRLLDLFITYIIFLPWSGEMELHFLHFLSNQ